MRRFGYMLRRVTNSVGGSVKDIGWGLMKNPRVYVSGGLTRRPSVLNATSTMTTRTHQIHVTRGRMMEGSKCELMNLLYLKITSPLTTQNKKLHPKLHLPSRQLMYLPQIQNQGKGVFGNHRNMSKIFWKAVPSHQMLHEGFSYPQGNRTLRGRQIVQMNMHSQPKLAKPRLWNPAI